jgi:hypothetical protein
MLIPPVGNYQEQSMNDEACLPISGPGLSIRAWPVDLLRRSLIIIYYYYYKV